MHHKMQVFFSSPFLFEECLALFSADIVEFDKPSTGRIRGNAEGFDHAVDEVSALEAVKGNRAEVIALGEKISNKTPGVADRHEKCPANIPGLPLHPIALWRIEHGIAFTDIALGLGCLEKLSLGLVHRKQVSVKMDVAVFVRECRAKAILAALVLGKSGRNLYNGF